MHMSGTIATFYITIKSDHMKGVAAKTFTLESKQGAITLPLPPTAKPIGLGPHVLQCQLINGQWQAISLNALAPPAVPHKVNAPTPRANPIARTVAPSPAARTSPPLNAPGKQATLIAPPASVKRAVTRGAAPVRVTQAGTASPVMATPPVRSVAKAATRPSNNRVGGFSQGSLPIPDDGQDRVNTPAPDPSKRDPVIHATGIDDWDEDDLILF